MSWRSRTDGERYFRDIIREHVELTWYAEAPEAIPGHGGPSVSPAVCRRTPTHLPLCSRANGEHDHPDIMVRRNSRHANTAHRHPRLDNAPARFWPRDGEYFDLKLWIRARIQ